MIKLLDLLKKSLAKAPVIKKGEYSYFQHPLTDGAPAIDPKLLKEVCSAIIRIANLEGVDLIVTPEAMGISIATMLSEMTEIPMNIIRKTPRYLPNELVLDQRTGYGKGKMYLNVEKGKTVFIVDAVISTGGTLISTLNGLKKIEAEIKDIVCVIERGEGKETVKHKTGYEVKTLVKIDVNEKVKVHL